MLIVDPANDEKEWIDNAISQVWPKYYDQLGKDNLNKSLKMLGRAPI